MVLTQNDLDLINEIDLAYLEEKEKMKDRLIKHQTWKREWLAGKLEQVKKMIGRTECHACKQSDISKCEPYKENTRDQCSGFILDG